MEVEIYKVEAPQQIVVRIIETNAIITLHLERPIAPEVMARARECTVFKAVDGLVRIGVFDPKSNMFINSSLITADWPVPPKRSMYCWQ